MNTTAIFTIASKNYLAYARTLLKSVSEIHSDVDLYLLLVDEVSNEFNKNNEIFEVIEAKDICIPDFHRMTFIYDILELNTAVKPFFMRALINKGYQKVIYFDPDIMLFDRLDLIFELLDNYSILLTPHITKSLPDDGCRPSEQSHLLTGTYNLGFIAVSNTYETSQFLDWWSEKCKNECLIELETGFFVDQKWINLVPGMFESVYILRNLGCNMAYWNLHERILDNTMVNGVSPLVFFHFSGFNADDLASISKYQNRYRLDERKDLIKIYEQYKERLIANGLNDCKSWSYKYNFYENGKKIGPIARRIYPLVSHSYSNPFGTGKGSYYELLAQNSLLEKNFATKMGEAEVKSKSRIINFFLKSVKRVLKVDKYRNLMKYMRYISTIRHQEFLLNQNRGMNS